MSPEEAVHYTNRLLEWQPTTIVNIGIAAGGCTPTFASVTSSRG
jgi:cephalosporin hydroxylase